MVGPTGSGKTTTLYVNPQCTEFTEKRIYLQSKILLNIHIEGITQVSVKPFEQGLGFADTLRVAIASGSGCSLFDRRNKR